MTISIFSHPSGNMQYHLFTRFTVDQDYGKCRSNTRIVPTHPSPGRCSVVRTPQWASVPAAEPIETRNEACMAPFLMRAVAASNSRFLSIISYSGHGRVSRSMLTVVRWPPRFTHFGRPASATACVCLVTSPGALSPFHVHFATTVCRPKLIP